MVVPNSGCTEEVLNLIKEKENIEKKITQAGNILSANNVNMNDKLVDNNGFPRTDIDIYQVRHARHDIICLQNDLKELMKKIDIGLSNIHTNLKTAATSSKFNDSPKQEEEESIVEISVKSVPIAKVNLVSPGSPAFLSGICAGDTIIEFGSVNSTNFKDLLQISEIVKHRQNEVVKIKVYREDKYLYLNLVPKTWNGRGLLGCNIVAVESIER